MNLLFLAFSNNPDDPLPLLKEEDDQVYSLLARRSHQQHFTIHRDSNTSVGKIAEYLVLFRDQISVFLYSGHAGRDRLLLGKQEANAVGIAELLDQCPNLKLIVLNGCSTQGQVARLLELKNHPVIIATSSPVGDREATQFSISFFQSLSEQHLPLGEAFDAAIGAAQTQAGQRLYVQRGAGFVAESAPDSPLWGIFFQRESALDWKLPAIPLYHLAADYTPNKYLIDQLVKTMAPHNAKLSRIWEEEEEGIEHSIVDKRETIMQCLPHPIGEQLRKLMVPSQGGSTTTFYDQPGVDRLRQMVTTYQTVMEMVGFIMLAQLWDATIEQPDRSLPADLSKNLHDFFQSRSRMKEAFHYLPLIQQSLQALEHQKVPLFVTEMEENKEIFLPNGVFDHACQFMEGIQRKLTRKETLESQEAQQLCMVAEEKLADVLGRVGFFANYTLASVKGIDVIKYHHDRQPRYRHQLVKLILRLGGLEEEKKILEQYMDNSSILLLHPTRDNGKSYLNLSPFLIDENAYDNKVKLAKLYFFHHYEKESDSYWFKHVYKPEDEPLNIHKQKHLKPIRAQFDAFIKLVFHQTLQEIL